MSTWRAVFMILVALSATCANKGRDGKRKLQQEKPNIILILTDDQDSELGSMQFMPKTRGIFENGGAKFVNAFCSSPICCPSRSTILTGLYTHNHNVYTNNDNCSSPYWQQTFEPRSFGKYLSAAGYRTGYFGKYLNEYNGSYIPPGWREWVGLVKNSAFYNYTVNFNGRLLKHGDNYYKDYLTDLIANDSVTFLKQSKQYFSNKPVAMVLSMPAPHGPEDAAPQYQHMFRNVSSHRTPNWNYAPNPDKMWLLQVTGKMEPIQAAFTDLLSAKRLQTLQSVDDAVEKMYTELKNIGELENTYMIYMSDHGYHLGQFGLPKGKSLPYESDIRIPFYIRGPGIQPGSKVKGVVGTVDIAPTILDLADIAVPEDMDGRSVKPLLHIPDENADTFESAAFKRRTWRDTFLLERGKITKRKQDTYEVMMDQLPIYFTQDGQIESKCMKQKYQSPCKPGQKTECWQDSRGRMRLRKCKAVKCECPASKMNHATLGSSFGTVDEASSGPKAGGGPFAFKPAELRARPVGRARSRSGSHALPSMRIFASRLRRELRWGKARSMRSDDDLVEYVGSFTTSTPEQRVHNISTDEQAFSLIDDTFMRKCRVVNTTILCSTVEHYTSLKEWKKHKIDLDRLILEAKEQLEKLKTMRKELKEKYDSLFKITAARAFGAGENDTLVINGILEHRADAALLSATPQDECVCSEVEEDEEERAAVGHYEEVTRTDSSPAAEEEEEVEEYVNEDLPLMPSTGHGVRHGTGSKKDGRRGSGGRKERKCSGEDRPCPKKSVRKSVKESRRNDPNCRIEGVECHVMDNEHWKVEPKWALGPFCYCINAQNNTMWCLRTINDTHNFLYCEFINGFIEYYDINNDPWQLRNAVFDLSFGVLHQLHRMLDKMRSCKGSKECHYRYRDPANMALAAGNADLRGPILID